MKNGLSSDKCNASDEISPEHPWWMEEANNAGMFHHICPPLIGDIECDAAIIGGGFTGLWTALALKDRCPSLDVVILESGICGSGASGKNGGIVSGYWMQYASLERKFGRDAAISLGIAGSKAQSSIAKFCHTRKEDVQLDTTGMAVVSMSEAQDKTVAEHERSMPEIPEEYRPSVLEKDYWRSCWGSLCFRAGLLYPDGGALQPARLVSALKRAAIESGVRIFEGTKVQELRAGKTKILSSVLGNVSSTHVVLASNAWLSRWRPHKHYLTNIGSYVMASSPIDVEASIGAHKPVPFKDGRMFLNWARVTHDSRIIVGNGAGPMSYGGRVDKVHYKNKSTADRTKNMFRLWFPDLADVKVSKVWGGAIDMSSDGVPYFDSDESGTVHYGVGYSGHGINATWIGGQILASLVLRESNEWTKLILCGRNVPKLPPEPVRYLAGRLIHASVLSIEDSLDKGEQPSLTKRCIAAVPRLTGMQMGVR